MRGVDLDGFDFDYDLTWAALILNADGRVYGPYGGRTPDSASGHHSLAGLRHALDAALAAHRREPPAAKAGPPRRPHTAEQYPAAARLSPGACIHCHNVSEFRREALQAAGKWSP